MSDSLMISNVYAAYSAAARSSEKSVSELSSLLRGEAAKAKSPEAEKDIVGGMDTVIISKEALDRLSGMSLVADKE